MPGYAIVTRISSSNELQPLALTFVEDRKGFRAWVNGCPGDRIKLPQEELIGIGDQTRYDGTTEANTFIVFVPESGKREIHVFWLADHVWKAWMYEVEDQERLEVGSGRRASYIQKLQTWRKWTKKQDAKF